MAAHTTQHLRQHLCAPWMYVRTQTQAPSQCHGSTVPHNNGVPELSQRAEKPVEKKIRPPMNIHTSPPPQGAPDDGKGQAVISFPGPTFEGPTVPAPIPPPSMEVNTTGAQHQARPLLLVVPPQTPQSRCGVASIPTTPRPVSAMVGPLRHPIHAVAKRASSLPSLPTRGAKHRDKSAAPRQTSQQIKGKARARQQ